MTQIIPKPESLAQLVLKCQIGISSSPTAASKQFSQVFDAIKQLITEDKMRKAKPSIGFL
jgi:hypothetical protein